MQKIQYAKGKSNIIAKLDGSLNMPAATVGTAAASQLQQSIFSAPPGAAIGLPPKPPGTMQAPGQSLPPPPGLTVPTGDGDMVMEDARSPSGSLAGRKRVREEVENEESDSGSGSDVAMEEDSEDD